MVDNRDYGCCCQRIARKLAPPCPPSPSEAHLRTLTYPPCLNVLALLNHRSSRARAHTQTQTQTHTRTRTHAHAHTHTHTRARPRARPAPRSPASVPGGLTVALPPQAHGHGGGRGGQAAAASLPAALQRIGGSALLRGPARACGCPNRARGSGQGGWCLQTAPPRWSYAASIPPGHVCVCVWSRFHRVLWFSKLILNTHGVVLQDLSLCERWGVENVRDFCSTKCFFWIHCYSAPKEVCATVKSS